MEVAESDKKLRKELSFIQLLFLSLGGIIGSGWLFGVLYGAATAGPASVLSWIIGGIMVIFIALVYAEISAAIPKSGGIVRYPHYTHGGYTGFILGWAYLLSAITVPAIEAIAAVTYLSSFPALSSLSYTQSNIYASGGLLTLLSATGVAVAILLMVGFFLLNYFGIKFLGKWNQYFVYWKLIIPSLTFIFLFTFFNPSNFTAQGFYGTSGGIANVFIAIPTAGIVFSYLGFRQALEFGGEAKNPQRDIPRALIFSVIIGMVVYVFLQLTFIGAINFKTGGISGNNWTGLYSSPYATGPFYTLFTSKAIFATFGAFATILLIDAVISPSGTGWIYMGTSTRVLYGLSTDGYLPSRIHKVEEKTGVPILALILSVVIGSIFIAPFPSWYLLVGFISSATVFTYIMGGVALRHFRKTVKELHRPFKLPVSSIIAPVGFVSAALIVYWSGYFLEMVLVFAILAGLPIYIMFYAPKELKLKTNIANVLGIVYWVIEAILFYLMFVLVLNPAYLNLHAAIPVSAPSSVFTYFPILFAVFALFVIGVTLYLFKAAKDGTNKEIRAGLWLIFFILTLAPLSFYGAFGPYLSYTPPDAAPLFFPWDNVVMIIDALVFYFLALYSGYGEEDVKNILREEGVPLPEVE